MTEALTNTGNAYRNDIRRGELYWLDWSPGRGSEQSGVRSALVIQADAGNSNPRYGLTIVATVSTKGKAHIPTHVELTPIPGNGLTEVSYVKAEQIMTISKDRLRDRLGRITEADMQRVETALRWSQGLS